MFSARFTSSVIETDRMSSREDRYRRRTNGIAGSFAAGVTRNVSDSRANDPKKVVVVESRDHRNFTDSSVANKRRLITRIARPEKAGKRHRVGFFLLSPKDL